MPHLMEQVIRYIGANFNNTTGANTISNWLVTPNVTIKNGDAITLYTRASPDTRAEYWRIE